MTMEQRKVAWANHIFGITKGALTPKEISLIVSICQDAFNEGHKAGYSEAKDLWSDLPEKEETDGSQ